jgi:Zn-dependent membrane protease YugP
MAVAAHECGHAVQHAKAYPWLSLRSELVPIVSLGSKLGQIVLVVGLILLAAGSSTTVAWIGLAMFATTTVFALVTLPVEFDASRRALQWLEASGVADRAMHGQAQTALRWAAMTYVAAALSSLAMLLYYALILLSRANSNRD